MIVAQGDTTKVERQQKKIAFSQIPTDLGACACSWEVFTLESFLHIYSWGWPFLRTMALV
jgi:hypothetical protein